MKTVISLKQGRDINNIYPSAYKPLSVFGFMLVLSWASVDYFYGVYMCVYVCMCVFTDLTRGNYQLHTLACFPENVFDISAKVVLAVD